jgi:hypothetical protein
LWFQFDGRQKYCCFNCFWGCAQRRVVALSGAQNGIGPDHSLFGSARKRGLRRHRAPRSQKRPEPDSDWNRALLGAEVAAPVGASRVDGLGSQIT